MHLAQRKPGQGVAGWLILPPLAALVLALSACSPPVEASAPAPVEAAPVVAEETGASDMLMPDDPDLRSKVEKMLLNAEVEGFRLYADVSKDFPADFAAMVDAMTASMRAHKPIEEVTLEGGRFGTTMWSKYSGNIPKAGPEKIRAVLTTRLTLTRRIRDLYSVADCNTAVVAENFNNIDTSLVMPELTQHIAALWAAMKAGLSSPHPQAEPTRADQELLAKTAIVSGASKPLIDNWLAGNLAPDAQKCEIAVELLSAELAMQGAAADRLQASSILSLPSGG